MVLGGPERSAIHDWVAKRARRPRSHALGGRSPTHLRGARHYTALSILFDDAQTEAADRFREPHVAADVWGTAADNLPDEWHPGRRAEGHTSELQSLMHHSYAYFCLK